MRVIILTLACASALSAVALAQTTVNPDISAIGDFRASVHTDEHADDDNRLLIPDPNLEIDLSGALNPYSRADVAVAWHGEERAEIEEAYLTVLRGLPLDAQFRAGRHLLQFGRLNTTHQHVWSFIQRPLAHSALFGEEGLRDVAFGASLLLPTGDVYTELLATVTKGDAFFTEHHEDDHEGEQEAASERDESLKRPGFFGRLTSSFPVRESGELALGFSALNSTTGDIPFDASDTPVSDQIPRAWIVGFDAKYRTSLANSRSLQIELEGLIRREDHPGDKNNASGAYLYLDYRFSQRHNAGLIVEQVRQTLTDETLGAPGTIEKTTSRAGLFVGFLPAEETLITRLAAHWTKPEGEDDFAEVTLQFLFGLGPHKIHTF